MKKIFLFSFFLIISVSRAQNSSDDIMQRFFVEYPTNTDKAIDVLFSENKWMQQKEGEILTLKNQLKSPQSLLGNYISYEKVREDYLGNSLKQVIYLVKHERQPLRFILVFYKINNDWSTYTFSFDDEFEEEFRALK